MPQHVSLNSWAAGLALVALVATSSPAPAQGSDDTRAPDYAQRVLDRAAGLSDDAENRFLGSDSRGFAWIGSDGGPHRFDGQRLRRYAIAGATRPQTLSDFHEGADGRVWHSTAGGLVAYRPGSDDHALYALTHPAPAPFGWHLAGYDAARGVLWVADGRSLLGVDPAAPWAEPRYRVASAAARYLVTHDTAAGAPALIGCPWLLRPGLERVVVDGDGVPAVTASADPWVAARMVTGAIRDRAGRCWLLTDDGLAEYDLAGDRRGRVARIAGPTTRIVSATAVDALLIVATATRGLWSFDPARGRFLRKLNLARGDNGDAEAEVSERVRAVHAVSERAVIVDDGAPGVRVLTPADPTLRRVEPATGAPLRIAATVAAPGDEAWVLTEAGSLLRVDTAGRVRCAPRFARGPAKTLGVPLVRGGDGALWHLRADGLYRIDEEACAAPRLVAAYANEANGVYRAPAGCWVLTLREFAACTAGGCVPVGGADRLLGASTDLYPLADGRFLARMAGGWLVRVGVEGGRAVALDSLRSPGEATVAAALAGGLLVGGVDGLYRYRERAGGWARDGEPAIAAIATTLALVPGRGALVATDDGLYGMAADSTWRIAGRGDLPDQGLREGRVSVGPGGRVWVAGRHALATGLAARLLARGRAPRARPAELYLDEAWVAGRPRSDIRAGSTVELGPLDRRLELRLGTRGDFGAEPPEYAYRVEGLDTAWRHRGTDGLVTLERLPAGTHRVWATRVDAAGAVGAPLSLTVRQLAPLAERTGFWIGMVGAAALLVALVSYGVYRRRLARERGAYERRLALERERGRIARELHDDLGGDLASILFLSDAEAGDFSDADRSEIAQLSRGALRNMRGIVWTLREGAPSVAELLPRLADDLARRCGPHGVTARRDLADDPALREATVTPAAARALELFVKEGATNVIKHARARGVTLSAELETPGALRVTLADDGVGYGATERPTERPTEHPTEHPPRAADDAVRGGVGVDSLRSRAEELGGRLEVRTRPEVAGTQLRMTVPLERSG